MRVLHVLNSAGGGASIGALELMRTSRKYRSGIEHFVVYPGLSHVPDVAVSSVCSGCRAIPMRWWNVKSGVSMVGRLATWVREMQITQFGWRPQRMLRDLVRTWKIDLIHTNNAAIIDGAKVAAQLGIPHVWHIRERIGRNGFMHFPLNDRELAERIGSLSRFIVPMSRFAGEIFVEHGQAAKTRVVYDGVDPERFDTVEARQRGQALRCFWGVAADTVLVGKVAAVTARVKRHEIFIRAAGILSRKYPDVLFANIGPLPKPISWSKRRKVEYFERLRTIVQEEGIESRFLWIDTITDVGAMMNAIDILAHACQFEGFGRVAIEAMAAGKPVVGPSAGGFAESVVHGQTGLLVSPEDPAAMAQAIERLIRAPALRVQYGEEGRRRARECFSPESHLQAMREIYNQALGQ